MLYKEKEYPSENELLTGSPSIDYLAETFSFK